MDQWSLLYSASLCFASTSLSVNHHLAMDSSNTVGNPGQQAFTEFFQPMAMKQAHWYCLRSPADEDEPNLNIQKYKNMKCLSINFNITIHRR
jgi:hypothetical protein